MILNVLIFAAKVRKVQMTETSRKRLSAVTQIQDLNMFSQTKYDNSFNRKPIINGEYVSGSLSKPRKIFFINALGLFLCIKGKINFLSLARYGERNEQYYRRQFEEKFDFVDFNANLIHNVASEKLVLMLGVLCIPKYGGKTYGVDTVNRGESEKRRKGVSFIQLSVLDIDNKTSLHLDAVQLPTQNYLKKHHITLEDYALSLLGWSVRKHPDISRYLYVEESRIKRSAIFYFKTTGLHLVSSLKTGISLYYMPKDNQETKIGRPAKYAGKVDFMSLDKDKFKIVQETDDCRISWAVLWDKVLRIKLLVTVVDFKDPVESSQKRYFSTCENLDPLDLVKYCQCAVLTEANTRDAVQYTGLHDCQARGRNKHLFHVNASLTSINIAKAECWLQMDKNKRNEFSMERAKRFYYNRYQAVKRNVTD